MNADRNLLASRMIVSAMILGLQCGSLLGFQAEPITPKNPYQARSATGTVQNVEAIGDRYRVEITIGSESGAAQLATVRIFDKGENPMFARVKGHVVEVMPTRSVCNVASRAGRVPRVGDLVHLFRDARSATVVVAKHLTFVDGEALTWKRAMQRLDVAAREERINVFFRSTDLLQPQLTPEWQELETWVREAKGRLITGQLSGQNAKYFDSIRVPEDLESEIEATGVVTANDKLITGAEVFACSKRMAEHIYLRNGRLRGPGTFPYRTITRNGRFTLYPRTDAYFVMCLHPLGFAVLDHIELREKVRVRLQPWATVRVKFEDAGKFDLGVFLNSTVKISKQVSIRTHLMEVPQDADGTFVVQHVPPGRVRIRRRMGDWAISLDKSFPCVEETEAKSAQVSQLTSRLTRSQRIDFEAIRRKIQNTNDR